MIDFITKAICGIICIFLGIFIGVVINAVAITWPAWAPAIYIAYGICLGNLIWTK